MSGEKAPKRVSGSDCRFLLQKQPLDQKRLNWLGVLFAAEMRALDTCKYE